jgi:hypothetical protein
MLLFSGVWCTHPQSCLQEERNIEVIAEVQKPSVRQEDGISLHMAPCGATPMPQKPLLRDDASETSAGTSSTSIPSESEASSQCESADAVLRDASVSKENVSSRVVRSDLHLEGSSKNTEAPKAATQRRGEPSESRHGTSRVTPGLRQTELEAECSNLPAPIAPCGLKPLSSQKLSGVSIEQIRFALQATEGPVQKFMREILACDDFSTTPWAESQSDNRILGTQGARQNIFFRRSRYRAKMPADVPAPVRKLIGIPEYANARSLFALGCSDQELVLVQQSFVQGIMYSDRFRLQNTFCFTQEDDGCLLSQWAETVWSKPLPWSHTPVKVFVEKRAKAEAKCTFRDFARTIQEACDNVKNAYLYELEYA